MFTTRKLVSFLMALMMVFSVSISFAEGTAPAADPFMKFDDVVEVHIGQVAHPTLKFPENWGF